MDECANWDKANYKPTGTWTNTNVLKQIKAVFAPCNMQLLFQIVHDSLIVIHYFQISLTLIKKKKGKKNVDISHSDAFSCYTYKRGNSPFQWKSPFHNQSLPLDAFFTALTLILARQLASNLLSLFPNWPITEEEEVRVKLVAVMFHNSRNGGKIQKYNK